MALKDLHKKLYEKKNKLDSRKLSSDIYDPEDSEYNNAFVNSDKLSYEDQKRFSFSSFLKENKVLGYVLIGIGVFVILFIVVFLIVLYRQNSFSQERVSLSASGPEMVNSGGETEYTITLANNNRARLENAVLDISYSSELSPAGDIDFWREDGNNKKVIEIGEVDSNETKQYKIPLEVYGTRDVRVYMDVAARYKPNTVSSFFEKKSQASSLIKASLLQLEIFPTKEVASGELMKIDYIISNKSDNSFDDVVLKANYPYEFSYQGANLELSGAVNNRWLINEIEPRSQKTISVEGTLDGEVGLSTTFSGEVGRITENGSGAFVKYSEAQDTSKVIEDRVEITEVVSRAGKAIDKNGVVSAGDGLNFQIIFKNKSENPLRNLVLRASILGRMVSDKDLIIDKGGYYDMEKHEIIWKASDFPALKLLGPNEQGSVRFSAKIKDNFPVENEGDTNFTIDSTSSIESLDVDSSISQNKKIYSEKISLKIKSKVLMNVAVNYNDGEIPNTGPVPVEPGNETTFTSRITIQNTANDLENAILRLSLPTAITWKSNFLPENENIQFNSRANELIWKIGELKAGTGFYLPVKFLAFQIGMTPTASQLNATSSRVVLINSIRFEAEDSFVKESVVEQLDRGIRLFDVADY